MRDVCSTVTCWTHKINHTLGYLTMITCNKFGDAGFNRLAVSSCQSMVADNRMLNKVPNWLQSLISCGAVFSNRSCLCLCLCVGGSVTTITRNCAYHISLLSLSSLWQSVYILLYYVYYMYIFHSHYYYYYYRHHHQSSL